MKKILLFITLIILSSFVSADSFPSIPHYIRGDVMLNNEPIEDGTDIKAMIDNIIIKQTETEDGEYSLTIGSDNPSTPEKEGGVYGDTITIKIHNQQKTTTWSSGSITKINFYITESQDNNQIQCTENWQCYSWTSCQNNEQTRRCTDTGTCQRSVRDEFRSCIPPQQEQENQRETCRTDWDCDQWSVCKDSKQTRTCTDKNYCKDDRIEEQECKEIKTTKQTQTKKTQTKTKTDTPKQEIEIIFNPEPQSQITISSPNPEIPTEILLLSIAIIILTIFLIIFIMI